MAKIHDQLTAEQHKNRKRLGEALALLLLGSRSASKLILAATKAAESLRGTIQGLHAGPRRLANAFTAGEGTESPAETSDPLLAQATAMGLVSSVIGTTQMLVKGGQSFEAALDAAVSAAGPRLDRIAVTETSTAFNNQVKANLADALGEWRWDATLDKRTCARCEALNGRRWDKLSDVPGIPAHTSCRCILEFIPAKPAQ